MDRTEQTRAMVRRYYDSLIERDWDTFVALLTEDVRYEIPQTSERITGKERYLRFNQEYPGDWQLSVTRLVADGSTAAASSNFTVGDERMVGVTFFELDGDLISRVTDFWPEPYEPPAGREHLVERLPEEVDRFSAS
jgi:ketosteroid isomerase-like protein